MANKIQTSRHVDAWEKIIKNSLDIICTIDRNGCYVNINDACKRVLGYEQEELVGRPISNYVHPEDLTSSFHSLEDLRLGKAVKNFKNRGIHKNGKEVHVLWSAVWSEEDNVILCVGRDVTEQEEVQRRIQRHQAMVEHGSDILALFDTELNFLHCGTSTLRELGYHPDQLFGTNALSYIHPDDVSLVKDALKKALVSSDPGEVSEFRFKDAKGEWRWLETRGSNQLHNPEVKALVTSSRDITERVNNRLRLQESKQRFKSLFDHHLDIVLFQNKEGVILDVNPATLSFFGIQKQEILNRPFSDFLSPEIVPVCEQTLQKALQGESVKLEVEIPFEGKGTYTFDIVKIPVEVNRETIGVYSILRDVTEVAQSNKIIKRQAEKLNTIMESITDAFFTLDKNWTFTYANKELERLFGIDRDALLGKSFMEVAAASIVEEHYNHYNLAITTGEAVHFETYIEEYNCWLEIKAFPSEEGLSVFLIDITERVKIKQELEMLSLVASKTTNGVVITDAVGLVEWVNEGFSNLTGYTLPEVEGKNLSSILVGEETDQATVLKLRESRKQGIPFFAEMLNYNKSGNKFWINLEVTPIRNEHGEVVKYTSIQTDITFRKEAEASQLQLTRDLFRQNQDLQQFTYIVSHNLRAPVANAMGLTSILATVDKESDTFYTSLGFLKTSVHQLDAVLRDLNMILSIRDNRNSVYHEKVQLAPVLQQAITNFQDSLKACGGQVIMDIEESIKVRGNKAYLYSIFFNLLSNSIKYRSSTRPLKVSIKCFSNTERGTVISFSDNGIGFDLDLAGDKVFKLYKRFHSNSEGRGIGLFLIRTHLETMGGRIEVSSQVGKGTRFLIYLK